MNKAIKEQLFNQAKEARDKAYVPYSNFPLGAALLTKEGKIFTGSNIENASFSLTNCAERTAVFKAVSEGFRDFEALLLVSDTEKPVTPCGACRQVITEFGDDIKIILTTIKGEEVEISSADLLPGAFSSEDLGK